MTVAYEFPPMTGPDVVVIRSRNSRPDPHLLWQFRDLLFAFAKRDIRLRYRQTLLGVAWVILQPLLGAAIFSIVFGVIAKMPSQGVPYFVISYSGMLGWTLFSASLTRIGSCLLANAELIRKVFFPRLLLPLGILPCTLLDFVFGTAFMAALMIIYKIMPDWKLILLPVGAIILSFQALGLGMIAGSLSVKYRDIQYILPLFVQLLMYASPVGYTAAAVPSYIKPFYDLNPLVAPIEMIRWSLIGIGQVSIASTAYSIVVAAILMAAGLFVFRLTERKFADVI